MQRDDHLPLNEIYSTPEALHEEVERILDLALYKVPEKTPIKLRFITPVSVERWLADDRYNDYRLTTPEEHADSMAYITVSYCWKHTQSTEILPPLPHYDISDWSKTGEPTPIGCPKSVFHRAMLFARSRKCAFIWIDQECIDQTNMADIQAHLKIMHRVYQESEWTVAPLSHPITDHRSLEQLITYLYHDCNFNMDVTKEESSEGSPVGEGDVSMFRKHVQATTELLMSITQDAWFSRTWTFQEKICAAALFLLVPVEVSPKTSDKVYLHMIGTDLCFDMAYFDGLSIHHEDDMDQIARLNNEVKWTKLKSSRLYNCFAISWDYASFGSWGYYSIFKSIQDCNNQVVADRVAIFGHVCRFRNRLTSDILALLLGNMDITHDGRLERVAEIWVKLEERSMFRTAAQDIAAWMMVLLVNDFPRRRQRSRHRYLQDRLAVSTDS